MAELQDQKDDLENNLVEYPYDRLTTRDGQLYMMCGLFQSKYTHELLESKIQTGPRLSLTYRLTSSRMGKVQSHSVPVDVSYLVLENDFCSKSCSYSEVYNELKDYLQPDVTSMFGKTYTNNGRMSGEFMLQTIWPNPIEFVYQYGNTKHYGNPMSPALVKLSHLLAERQHINFDWCHVTWYPNEMCKISAHADDEPEIKPNSDIACISFMENPKDTRDLRFRIKNQLRCRAHGNEKAPKPKRRKRNTETDLHLLIRIHPKPKEIDEDDVSKYFV
jgi:hypothetical protein